MCSFECFKKDRYILIKTFCLFLQLLNQKYQIEIFDVFRHFIVIGIFLYLSISFCMLVLSWIANAKERDCQVLKVQNNWQIVSIDFSRYRLQSLQSILDNAQGATNQNTRIKKLQVQKIRNLPSSTDQDMNLQNLIKA